MTDPIADMLTRLRNALAAKQEQVRLPHSGIKEAIAGILKANGYIASFKVEADGPFKQLVIELFGPSDDPAISQVDRLSRPGRRIYSKSQDLSKALAGRGLVIVSTSGGLMTDREARKRGLGGELICRVW